MTTDFTGLNDTARAGSRRALFVRSDSVRLRALAITAGIGVSLLFVALGLRYELQMYADGSLFSYAVAVRDAWAFHCHNISGRLTVYLFAFAPAEAYVQLTGDPQGGVALYGFMFFVAQILGLFATFLADRSGGRVIFTYACVSTACLCPLVFGFPTEVWMMHALFWPTLAVCHYASRGFSGIVLLFALLLALIFTHAGALISIAAILATLSLRGLHDPAFRRAGGLAVAVASIWLLVKAMLRPDDYIAGVLVTAALHVFDISILTGTLILLLFCTLAGYALAFWIFQRLNPARAHIYAAALVVVALAVYWLRFDHALHAVNRYYLRTILLVATPAFGMLAAAHALSAEGELNLAIPYLPRLMTVLTGEAMARAAIGAVLLVMLIHTVETTKFIAAWTDYKVALRSLAMGTAADPVLGHPRFVSSSRIGTELNKVSWFSTTHFLSVLVAPNLKPARLVVDPGANYFWLSCETAAENLAARRSTPAESRELVRAYSCLHRRRRVPTLPR